MRVSRFDVHVWKDIQRDIQQYRSEVSNLITTVHSRVSYLKSANFKVTEMFVAGLIGLLNQGRHPAPNVRTEHSNVV